MTDHKTRPTPSSDVAAAIEALPRRQEKISGQTFSYVKLEDVTAVVSRLSTPAQVEVTDENAFTVTICAAGDNENTAQEAIHHGLAYAHRAGYITAWSDPVPALTCTDAKPVVPAEPVAGWKMVPVEPTDAMRAAWYDATDTGEWCWSDSYAAMVAAAPAPPSPVEGDGWQPIETAPENVDLWLCADHRKSGDQDIYYGMGSILHWQEGTGTDWQWGFPPTHWKPITPPRLASEGNTDA